MVYAKYTNASIEKHKEDFKIATINSSASQNGQKNVLTEKKWNEKYDTKNKPGDTLKGKFKYCGKGRHPTTGSCSSWKDKCPSKNVTCKDCK